MDVAIATLTLIFLKPAFWLPGCWGGLLFVCFLLVFAPKVSSFGVKTVQF